jgi:hypothetical protein
VKSMSRLVAGLVVANLAFLAWNVFEKSSFAQRPPEVNQLGEAYLRVNINPTNVPPMVNVNPNGNVPKVEVTRLPEIPLPPPSGCEIARGYETGVSRTISGPIQLGFLNSSQTGPINFVDNANRSYRVTLRTGIPLQSIIYLGSGQKLEFDSEVLYSGCRP